MTRGDGPKRPSFGVGLRAALVLLAVLMPGCSPGPSAVATPEVEAKTAPDDAAPSVPYEVEIRGVEDRTLRELLQEASETRRLIDRPPPSLTRLRRRAEDDRARLQRALR